MSKVEELINEKCPNGVEYNTVNSLVDIINGYKTINKKEIISNGIFPVVDQGQNFINGYSNEKDKVLEKSEYIIFGDHTRVIKYVNFEFIPGDSGVKILKSKNVDIITNKYLYHCLKNLKIINRGYNRHWTVLSPMKVPIPPIEVQEEIVRILDKFSELEADLEAELEARKKQYEFWRGKLFKNSKNVQMRKISDVFKKLKGTPITAGQMKKIATGNGNIRIFAGGKTMVDTLSANIPKKDIITVPSVIVQSRGLIDFIYYDNPFSFKNEMWAYTCDNLITTKYLFYYLKTNIEYFRTAGSQMGSMPQISLPVTENFEIFIPDLPEQERTVSILDKFDKLINDINEGIPAEIELRKQQYEYYRNRLLSFKELM